MNGREGRSEKGVEQAVALKRPESMVIKAQ